MSTAIEEAKKAITNGQPKSQVRTIAETLSHYAPQIAQAIPKSRRSELSAERIIQIAATVIASKPALEECTPASIVGSVLQAACLGLNPLPVLAECYLVGIKKKCELWVGYRGWINLFHRCPIIRDITARVVCEEDDFSYAYGLDEHLLHTPRKIPTQDGSNITHAYAIARYVNGGQVFVVLTKYEIDRLGGRGGGKGPAWSTDAAAMAQAKAIKQLQRFVPSGDSDLSNAISVDGAAIDLDDFNMNGGGLDLLSLTTGDDVADVVEGEVVA